MSLTSQLDVRPDISAAKNELLSAQDAAKLEVLSEITGLSTTLLSELAAHISNVISEANENQALIEALVTVSGQVDSTATAVNNHTDIKTGEVLTALAALVFAKPGDVSAAQTAILNAIGQIDTSGPTNAARDAVLAEIVRTGTGSLYQLLNSAIVSARDSVNGNVDTERQAVINEIRRTTSGSLYALLDGRINTRATPGDVTAARDSINGNVDAEGASIRDLINSRAENSLADWIRDRVVEAQNSINGNVDAESATIQALINSRESNSLADWIRDRVIEARDSINSNVDTERQAVINEIRSTTSGSLYALLDGRINTRATPGDVTAARDSINGNVDAEAASIRDLINSRAENSLADWIRDRVIEAQNNINSHIDTERAVITNSINTHIDTERTTIVGEINQIPTTMVKSRQTGFVDNARSGTSSGEDGCFFNITIAAVNTGKCLLTFEGGASNANQFAQSSKGSDSGWNGQPTYQVTARLTSSNNLRLASYINTANARITGRWTVVEFY